MLNNVILVGRLTRDPELRKTNSGNSVCSFTLAVDNEYKDAEGNKTASFSPCVTFNQSAENLSKFLRKGKLVAIIGRLNQRTFTREDGSKGFVIEVICDSCKFLEKKEVVTDDSETEKKVKKPSKKSAKKRSKKSEELDLPDDDMPF